ncbi:hypothetical protein WICPIJ_000535 [Wickerhamomyces pijperi]|uniref:BRO1 domain-containing protein n=1 Tax=Wickerhamomyces pijperi TaxID=599730 RepID=A0A9P8QCD4_WICPI|nr:hypothetical protein WICPIJ_000535 [Wickerhamomyces pijperi]
MLQIPLKLIQPKTIQAPPTQSTPLVQSIHNRRLQTVPVISNQSSTLSSTISALEDYLNDIYGVLLAEYTDSNYLQVASKCDGSPLCFGMPWYLPFTTKDDKTTQWTIRDEICVVVLNLSTCYSMKANELISTIVSTVKSEEDNQWVTVFKYFKKALSFTNFLINQDRSLTVQSQIHSDIFELSDHFTNIVSSSIKISIQSTFLLKSILTLSRYDYDIDDLILKKSDSINFSTMTRITVFIKTELQTLRALFNQSVESNLSSRANRDYSTMLANFHNINEIYLGLFLSVELYRKDEIGDSIAVLNHAIELIASKNNNGKDDEDLEEESKLKAKLSKFKSKLKSQQPKKLRINRSLLSPAQYSNPPTFIQAILSQYQTIESLNYKLHLQNNSMAFQQISTDPQSVLEKCMPLGRSVPLADGNNNWIPSCVGSASTAGVNDVKKQYY